MIPKENYVQILNSFILDSLNKVVSIDNAFIIYINEPKDTHTYQHKLHPLGLVTNGLTILSIPHQRAKSKSIAILVLRVVSATLSDMIRNFETTSNNLYYWVHNEAYELTELLLKKKRREGIKKKTQKRTSSNSLICAIIKYY